MATIDAMQLRDSLRRLSASRTAIFGANSHSFLLNPPLTETEMSAFEQRHSIRLPAEYRHFLGCIGNGGAGPYYGVFPLGMMDDLGDKLKPWRENDGFIGLLSKPFPLKDEWNDVRGMPSDELLETDEQEYERQLDEFEKGYWISSLVNGAIPICHQRMCVARLVGVERGARWSPVARWSERPNGTFADAIGRRRSGDIFILV